MKNKKLSVFFLLFFLTFSFFAENNSFEFQPEFGFINGTIIENVWYCKKTYTNSKIIYTPTSRLSRLDWQFDKLPYFGFNSKLNLSPIWFIGLDGKFNTKSKFIGIMEDYDWDCSEDITALNKYSKHNLYLNSYYNVKFKTGAQLNINSILPQWLEFSFIPYIGFAQTNISFSGFGGSGVYNQVPCSILKHSPHNEIHTWKNNEEVISYSQSMITPFLGIKTDTVLFDHLFLDLSGTIHYINKLTALDSHIGRSNYFKDEMKNTVLVEAEGCIGYKINKNNSLNIKAAINYIPDSVGFTYSSSTPDDFSSKPEATSLGGTSRFLWSYSLAYSRYF